MNAEAFIMKGKSVIAMSQGDVTGGLYGLYPLLDISIFKDTYIRRQLSYLYLAMRTGSSTLSSELTCSLKILKDHNLQINSFLILSFTLDRRSDCS
jgi:hypothetical protein